MILDLQKKEKTGLFSVREYDDIYIDTCSLLEDGLGNCLRGLIPELIRTGQKIVIPYPVVQELSYLCGGVTSTCCAQAQKAKTLACKLMAAGLAECTPQMAYSEQADHYFVKAVSTNRFQRKIALITQDRQLTEDINLLNRIHSAQAKPVHTYKLEKGMLVRTHPQRQPMRGTAGNIAEVCRRLGLS